jgi:hypothetical protein
MRQSCPVHGPEAEPASGPASRHLTARSPALRVTTARHGGGDGSAARDHFDVVEFHLQRDGPAREPLISLCRQTLSISELKLAGHRAEAGEVVGKRAFSADGSCRPEARVHIRTVPENDL